MGRPGSNNKPKSIRALIFSAVFVTVMMLGGVYSYLSLTALDRLLNDYDRYSKPADFHADFLAGLYHIIYGDQSRNFLVDKVEEPRVGAFFRQRLKNLAERRGGTTTIST